jgi:excisionase family DNA binding protein
MPGRRHFCRKQSASHDVGCGDLYGRAADATVIDPRTFGLVRAAYGVDQVLELLSIGRTSLYAAVRRGELKPVKFGKKTLFYASDLAAFLMRLKEAASKSDAASWRQRS